MIIKYESKHKAALTTVVYIILMVGEEQSTRIARNYLHLWRERNQEWSHLV